MIKLTRVASSATNAPKIFVIAGGPGLSSLTLRNLDLLRSKFELVYLDFQGTNDSEYLGKKSFSELCTLIGEAIKNESGKKYLLGHSYGGVLAAGILAQVFSVDGLICIAAPFSKASLDAANVNYNENKTPALEYAASVWADKQDDDSFRNWLSEYGPLWFKSPKGKELMLSDKVSAQFFIDNRSDISNHLNVIDEIFKIKTQKIFIAGSEDKLLPPEILKNDATNGGFEFFEIPEASHFVTLDQPEKVAGLIESQLLRS